ncbi:MAG: bifunctional folylpolyglutamate synthase/dihydrofolate synthase [Cyclobacteriaceae bacterium]|nr:bifunctional folylpolyglutamate synthase/dihydrofolate synthase [Cyclobacteriaceae bacterium]
MFLSYEDTLQFLYDALPMFQRIGAAALKNDLSNTLRLCAALGNPQEKFKAIHIAGTNGKGSTAHMLASILQSAGYKTGLYTSPHLKHFTERIRINGSEVRTDFVVDFVNRIHPLIAAIQPSFFEITVAMAFDYFAHNAVDVAVIEVGLGGRLDSTNVIRPELSLITNIGWDHKDLLGDSLEKIAAEKAGIIKAGVPAVISERQPEVDAIFIAKCSALSAAIYFATDHYQAIQHDDLGMPRLNIYRNTDLVYKDIALEVQGFYQRKNVLGVIQAIDVLRSMGWTISDEHVAHGLRNVASQTGLKGRWQVLGKNPLKICDTAHNIEGILEVVNQIKVQPYKNLYMVIGMVSDKDVVPMLQLLPKEATYYFCEAKIPRALAASKLAARAREAGLRGTVIPDVTEAISTAAQSASSEDMIFIGGSTFVVAEIEGL